jgi:hypothetical protein
MRKYKVEAFKLCDEPKKPEIIEADAIRASFGAVEFLKNDVRFEDGYRVFAIRMNCNVSELPEEKQ